MANTRSPGPGVNWGPSPGSYGRASSPLGLPCGVVGKLTNIVSSGFLPAAADTKAGIYVQEL